MISVYFLWFDNETFKKLKYWIVLSQHTSYLHKWLVHLNCDMFAAVIFIFFCEIPTYVQGQNKILSHSIGWIT